MSDGEVARVNFRLPKEGFRSALLELVYRGDGAQAPETVMSTGTGFFYRTDGKDFLVTARHNVTGWDEARDQPLSRHGVGPTHLRVGFWPAPTDGKFDLSDSLRIHIYQHSLFEDRDSHSPRWLEHPRLGGKVDVVALPMNIPAATGLLYQPWRSGESDVAIPPKKLWVTQGISIVGYPYGLNSNNLPLWVQGTIASEPDLMYMFDGEPMPLFIADARTREGQSGAPVLQFRHPGSLVATDDGVRITKGTQSKLLGVYTGRVNRESDLGFVWHIGEVDYLCRHGVVGTNEPQRSADPKTMATEYTLNGWGES